jgi:ATP-dependent Clp protease protease subunit
MNRLARLFARNTAPRLPKIIVGGARVLNYDPDQDGDQDEPGLPDVDDDAKTARVFFYDVIGGWDQPQTAALVGAIKSLDVADIHIHINSPGGMVFESVAIKTALEQHPAAVHAHVDGLAASAASTLMLAGDTIDIASGAFVMIHNPETMAWGDATEMRASADMLDAIRDSIAAQYVSRTGLAMKDVVAMMAAETWLSADDAVAQKFCDAVMTRAPRAPNLRRFDLTAYNHAPALLEPAPALDAGLADRARALNARLRLFDLRAA